MSLINWWRSIYFIQTLLLFLSDSWNQILTPVSFLLTKVIFVITTVIQVLVYFVNKLAEKEISYKKWSDLVFTFAQREFNFNKSFELTIYGQLINLNFVGLVKMTYFKSSVIQIGSHKMSDNFKIKNWTPTDRANVDFVKLSSFLLMWFKLVIHSLFQANYIPKSRWYNVYI